MCSETLESILRGEKETVGQFVLAPVASGKKVRIQLDGILYECLLEKEFNGWGIFKLQGNGKAELVREAEMWEKERYAEKFPCSSLVLFYRDTGGLWWARDMKRDIFVAVYLVEGMQQFDVIIAVFDGSHSWFVSYDSRFDGRRAQSFRAAIEGQVGMGGLNVDNLTEKERELYRMALAVKEGLKAKDREAFARDVEEALKKGSGRIVECIEVGSTGYRVTWNSGYRGTLTTIVDKNMSVLSAGLCLSGGDRLQDLASLASLLSAPKTK
jgi:hypothetical protein